LPRQPSTIAAAHRGDQCSRPAAVAAVDHSANWPNSPHITVTDVVLHAAVVQVLDMLPTPRSLFGS